MTIQRITLSIFALLLSFSLRAGEPQSPVLPVVGGHIGECYAIDSTGEVFFDLTPEVATAFPQLVHEHIYPNIDLVVYRHAGTVVAYEFVVFPGGDPSQIRVTDAMLTETAAASQNLTGVTTTKVALDWLASEDGWQPLTGSYEQAQILTIRME